jgi:iron(II)-dependent oxidoreductase
MSDPRRPAAKLTRAASRRAIDAQVTAAPPVRLQPILGLQPGVYLTLLLGAAIAAVAFLTLVVPGLAFNGAIVTVTTSPPGATVRIDGSFAGVTPTDLRLRRGARDFQLNRVGFLGAGRTAAIPGRVFASWPFPRRTTEHFLLPIQDATALLDSALRDFSESSHVPRILSDTARAAPTGSLASVRYAFLYNMVPYLGSQDSVWHAVDALTRFSSSGSAFSPRGLRESLSFFIQAASTHPQLPALLAAVAPTGLRAHVSAAPWYRSWRERDAARLAANLEAQPPAQSSSRGGLAVRGSFYADVPATTFVMGDAAKVNGFERRGTPVAEMPHLVSVPGFLIATEEATKRDFAAFVNAEPSWAPENRAALVEQGLANTEYLADWLNGEPAADELDHPVVFVSAYAAEAYARWLSDDPVVAGAGLIARLPYEPEWELATRGGRGGQRFPNGTSAPSARLGAPRGGAAAVGYSDPNDFGLRDTIGNVWEWTGDWHAPNSYYLWRDFDLEYGNQRRLRIGSQRVVRGGSFVNESTDLAVHTRGAQPADWATPVLGFRLVLVAP